MTRDLVGDVAHPDLGQRHRASDVRSRRGARPSPARRRRLRRARRGHAGARVRRPRECEHAPAVRIARAATWVGLRARPFRRRPGRSGARRLARAGAAPPMRCRAAYRLIADGPVAAAALLPLARRRGAVYLAHNLESGFRGDGARAGAVRTRGAPHVLGELDGDPGRSARRGASWRVSGSGPDTCPTWSTCDGSRRSRRRGGTCWCSSATSRTPRTARGCASSCDEVLPLAWRSRPGVRLIVAGRGCPGAVVG